MKVRYQIVLSVIYLIDISIMPPVPLSKPMSPKHTPRYQINWFGLCECTYNFHHIILAKTCLAGLPCHEQLHQWNFPPIAAPTAYELPFLLPIDYIVQSKFGAFCSHVDLHYLCLFDPYWY